MAEVGHLPADPSHRKVALLIAVLALILSCAETLAKGAQTTALSANVEAANLWAFFQAKTIRMTVVRTAAEMPPSICSWSRLPRCARRSRNGSRTGSRRPRAMTPSQRHKKGAKN